MIKRIIASFVCNNFSIDQSKILFEFHLLETKEIWYRYGDENLNNNNYHTLSISDFEFYYKINLSNYLTIDDLNKCKTD